METSVKREAPAVIPATQLLLVPRAVDHERAAVGADVRHAVELVLLVARQKEWLVERAREQRERGGLPRGPHEGVVSGVVPGARGKTIALESEELPVGRSGETTAGIPAP